MSEMMKCFVMHGIGKVGMIEKPIPRSGYGDAVFRTMAELICTDCRWRGQTADCETGSTP